MVNILFHGWTIKWQLTIFFCWIGTKKPLSISSIPFAVVSFHIFATHQTDWRDEQLKNGIEVLIYGTKFKGHFFLLQKFFIQQSPELCSNCKGTELNSWRVAVCIITFQLFVLVSLSKLSYWGVFKLTQSNAIRCQWTTHIVKREYINRLERDQFLNWTENNNKLEWHSEHINFLRDC